MCLRFCFALEESARLVSCGASGSRMDSCLVAGHARIAVALLLIGLWALGCDDARCPAGTVESSGHCVNESSNVSSSSSDAPSQTSPQVVGSPTAKPMENAGSSPIPAGVGGSNQRMENAGSLPSPAGVGGSNMGDARPALKNGELCTGAQDCASGVCANAVSGRGICCDKVDHCCVSSQDCSDSYRTRANCNDPENCQGVEKVAVCMANVCTSMIVVSNNACFGISSECGAYKDIICTATGKVACQKSCTDSSECDSSSYCAGRECLLRKASGQSCSEVEECLSGNCDKQICCEPSSECCRSIADCTDGLDAKCDLDPTLCQGSAYQAFCENSGCRYSTSRGEDDRACAGRGNDCANKKDLQCTGEVTQTSWLQCLENVCTSASDCDDGLVCAQHAGDSSMRCWPPA
jgi:hypothetical protein